jgi:hypothetical protein
LASRQTSRAGSRAGESRRDEGDGGTFADAASCVTRRLREGGWRIHL